MLAAEVGWNSLPKQPHFHSHKSLTTVVVKRFVVVLDKLTLVAVGVVVVGVAVGVGLVAEVGMRWLRRSIGWCC